MFCCGKSVGLTGADPSPLCLWCSAVPSQSRRHCVVFRAREFPGVVRSRRSLRFPSRPLPAAGPPVRGPPCGRVQSAVQRVFQGFKNPSSIWILFKFACSLIACFYLLLYSFLLNSSQLIFKIWHPTCKPSGSLWAPSVWPSLLRTLALTGGFPSRLVPFVGPDRVGGNSGLW